MSKDTRLVGPALIAIAMFVCACRTTRTHQGYPPLCSELRLDRPPVLRRLAPELDSVAADRPVGRLVILLDSSKSRRPVASARVGLLQPGPAIYAFSDTTGRAMLKAPSGDHVLQILAVGWKAWTGPVTIRGGYTDTFRIGLTRAVECLDEVGFP